MRRGISILIGGAFEQPFCNEGREFEQANPGVLKLQFDWYIRARFQMHKLVRSARGHAVADV